MLNIRIKQRRQELNMTQKELADLTGYKTKGAISRIENGERDLSQSQITTFAKALKTSESYLMGWTDELIVSEDRSLYNIIIPDKLTKLPILGEIACGDPIFAEENYQGYFIADSNIKADFVLIANGDSMIDANIFHGDLVFIKKTPVSENGRIVAVLIDNEATLKRITYANDKIILQPANKNYKPIILDERNDVSIIGEMVGIYQSRNS